MEDWGARDGGGGVTEGALCVLKQEALHISKMVSWGPRGVATRGGERRDSACTCQVVSFVLKQETLANFRTWRLMKFARACFRAGPKAHLSENEAFECSCKRLGVFLGPSRRPQLVLLPVSWPGPKKRR